MKRKLAKILCVVITAIMITGTFSVAAYADETSVINGTFTIPAFVGNNAEETFFYTDNYFTAPSTTQNEHLTTMSLALAITAMNYYGESDLTALYGSIGFKDVSTADMDIVPTRDTIGTAIAHKKIGGSELVAVAVRGGSYDSEWAANVTSGVSGDVEGFSVPAKKVIERIKTYISENKLENVKLWVAGYSRAGAVSDLIGVYVNENLSEFNTAADDVFVFAFEAPRCSTSDKVYNNVYCVKNKNDIVTYVYPQCWGMYTNGVDIIIGEDKAITKAKLDLFSDNKIIPLGEVKMDEYNRELVDFVFGEIKRDTYSAEFDDALAQLIELYYSKPSSDWDKTFSFVKTELLDKLTSNPRFMYIVFEEIKNGVMDHNSDKMYKQLTDELILLMNESVTAKELGLSQQEYKTVCDGLYCIVRVLGPVLVKDYIYQEGIDLTDLLPQNYMDPEFDPQNENSFIPTFDQYQLMEDDDPQTIDEPVPYEPTPSTLGYYDGYEDGKNGTFKREQAPEPENAGDYTAEQLEAYKTEYMEGYENGYEAGEQARISQELPEDYHNGNADAFDAAKHDANRDAYEKQYKANYNDTPNGVFSDDYIKGYKAGYAESYDFWYAEYVVYYEDTTLYHVGTFAANWPLIIAEHFPQNIWDMITKLDSNYDVKEDPKRDAIIGDIDGDGAVTSSDALMILRSSVNMEELTVLQMQCGDIDNDAMISSYDALVVLRFSVGYKEVSSIGIHLYLRNYVGTWEGKTAIGKVRAVINEDGTAVLSSGILKLNTTWSLDDDIITVIILGNPESFKLDGDTMVNVNDSSMVFGRS